MLNQQEISRIKQICVLDTAPGYAYGMKYYLEDWMGKYTQVHTHFKMDTSFLSMNWSMMDVLIVENLFVRSMEQFKTILEIKKEHIHLKMVLNISSTLLLMNENFFAYEHFIFDGIVSKDMDKSSFITVMRKVLKIKSLIDV
jgi:hypothetical protein